MATTLHEFDHVELLVSLSVERTWFPDLDGDPHLVPGDQGAVVDLHPDGSAAVEFMRGEHTVALADVQPDEVRVVVASHGLRERVVSSTD